MNNLSDMDLKNLFSNLCCSKCKNDFDADSILIKEKNSNLLICELKCTKCGKDFGEIILGMNNTNKKHLPLEVLDCGNPIDYDDVIEAHNFIRDNL